MSKQGLQLLNIEVGTFKQADDQLALDIERKLFKYDRISESDGLKHDDSDFLQLTNLIEEDHHVVLAYLLLNRVKDLKALPKEGKARLNTTKDIKTMVYHYIPISGISQTSGEPVLTAGDSVKGHLITNHENVTALYSESKDYLNKNTDSKASEKPLAELDEAKGYFREDVNEIVIGGDEPDSQLKLKTLYHEFAHNQLHGLDIEYNDRPRPYKETQAEAVAYVAVQSIGTDTGEYSLGYVAVWTKDKEAVHNALSGVQPVSKEAVDIADELTQRLGLQEEQEENDNFKAETKRETTSENKQPTNNSSKSLSDRVRAQFNEFIKQNPDMKKSGQEQAQELRM